VVPKGNEYKNFSKGQKIMKKILLLLLFTSLFSLTGCSNGISQEEYDSINTEKENLQKELDNLQSEYSEMKSNYESLEQTRKEETMAELDLATVKAWVTASFGDDSIYFVNEPRFLQCISSKKYSLTEDGVTEAWSNTLVAAAALGQYKNKIVYDRIAVKYMSDSNNCFLEVILKRDGDTYALEKVLGDIDNSNVIISGLSNTSN